METVEPQPSQRPAPDMLIYRASLVRVLLTLSPFVALLLAGCAVQYANQGTLSSGMEWVLVGTAAFVVAAASILPRINYLEFTPQYFTVRELAGCKQIPWGEIEPGSMTYVVRTFCGIPLLTNIGFRLKPDSPHLTMLRTMASAQSGMHVYFVNMYSIGRDEILATIRSYQERFGTDHRRLSGAPATEAN